jgi:hypothetical protein
MADSNVTRILADLSAGDRSAAERLLPHVYDELRALVATFFRQRQPNQTLQPTAQVHEAFVKLVGSANQNWTSKKHFFSVAAMAMRRSRLNSKPYTPKNRGPTHNPPGCFR